MRGLVAGQHLGADLVDAQLPRATAPALPWLSPVSSTVRMPSACSRRTACARRGLTVSPKASRPSSTRRAGHARPARTRCGPRLCSCAARAASAPGVDAEFLHQARAAEAQVAAVDLRRDAAARQRRARRGAAARDAFAARPRRSTARASGCSLPVCRRRRQRAATPSSVAARRARRPPVAACPRSACRSCRRRRPSTRVRDLQRLGVLDQDAVARRDAGAGHDGRRRGQAQRAGAGDHQHRHRIEQRRLPVAGRQPPAEQRDQRDQPAPPARTPR